MRRVVVTGVGALSALGPTRREFWRALSEGRSGIRPLEGFPDAGLRFEHAAQVFGFEPEAHFEPGMAEMIDRFAQFAVVAAREAAADSGIEWTERLRERTAVVTGACVGGQASQERVFASLYVEKRPRAHPFTVPRVMMNAGASHISMDLGTKGPTFTVSTACSSSNHAIGQAFTLVRAGAAELAIAGGSEAPFTPGHLKAWEALRVVAPDTCRPFSKDRKGMILAEGAAMLVLEPLAAALARGARIYGEVVGFGMSSDAHHLTQPSAEGPARAMQAALDDGGLRIEQIGYINAHGTGTLANDATEARAIHLLANGSADRIAVSATKSMHGHALGAAGALEAVATMLALSEATAPPTANFSEPDPECALDVVPNQPRPLAADYALSNSFAFGGLNAVLAFRRIG